MKKITYISYYTFNKIKYDQFGLEYLKQFLDISIIDLSKSHKKQKEIEGHKSRFNNMFVLENVKEIKQTLAKISPDYIVPMGPENFVNEVLEIAQDFKFKSFRLFNNPAVDTSEELNLHIKIKYFVQLIFVHLDFKSFFFILFKKIKSFLIFLVKKIFTQKKKIFYADKIISAGDKAVPIKLKKGKKNFKIIYIHSVDYQNYLDYKFQSLKNIDDEKVAVFLDQILLHHPDNKLIQNFDTPVSSKYLDELKKFFIFIKTKFNYEIIIALHPRCDENTFNLYEDFFKIKCFRNKTVELISKSNIVIAHPSTTALSYPIIFRKPLIFITTNELEKNYYKYVTFRMTSKIIKQPFVNISKEECLQKLKDLEKIDQKGYLKYFSNYIKNQHANDESLWKCFLQNL